MVGYYTDTYFPDMNVRFIAVNDNIDSDEGENEIAPFKNIINEWYARDISNKVKSSYRIRGNLGEPLAPPPYGYIKSPENPKKWIVDPEAAKVVKDIFRMCLEGKKNYTQQIVIYYRFVGFIEIPRTAEDENYKADTRTGVEVEYIPAKSA